MHLETFRLDQPIAALLQQPGPGEPMRCFPTNSLAAGKGSDDLAGIGLLDRELCAQRGHQPMTVPK